MRDRDSLLVIALFILLIAGLPIYGADLPGQLTAEARYPCLFSGTLKLAIPCSLTEGELLIAG